MWDTVDINRTGLQNPASLLNQVIMRLSNQTKQRWFLLLSEVIYREQRMVYVVKEKENSTL